MTSYNTGILVISLDFEMMWGAIDWSTPEEYGQSNIAKVPKIIERLLKLFSEYDIHATFATVGFIFCHNKEDLLDNIPLKKPSYINKKLSPYTDDYIGKISKEHENLYFANKLIRKISNTKGMEIATHTACHYNCSASGQTIEEFKEDLETAKKIALRDNLILESIVFPRNEVDEAYLKECENVGILTYRGNALKFYNNGKNKLEDFKNKIFRFLDNYLPIDKKTTYTLSSIVEGKRYNVRASRFLRPYSNRLSLLEGIRLRRIKNEITRAAKKKEIYHLWWHPHNFGINIENNFIFLKEILKHYKYCQDKYGLISMNMHEITNISNR